MSDHPADRPVPLLARASARNARTQATGRTMGQPPSVPNTSRPARLNERRRGPTTKREKKKENREKVIIPTPEEWAQQQLKNAPPRSEEWAKRVARIYCLDIGDDDKEEKTG